MQTQPAPCPDFGEGPAARALPPSPGPWVCGQAVPCPIRPLQASARVPRAGANVSPPQNRFLLWDDYRPVQYAQKTVEVSTVLSLFNGLPFEVQVSQSFHDGNPDFRWDRGAVATAPQEGLWDPKGTVTPEDIRHMRNRFHPFQCTAVIRSMQDMDPCAVHMCRWIVDGANAADARAALRPPLALPAPGDAASAENPTGEAAADVAGLGDLAKKALLPPEATTALRAELLSEGAVDVAELTAEDWAGLSAWGQLKQFEQRRLLKCI